MVVPGTAHLRNSVDALAKGGNGNKIVNKDIVVTQRVSAARGGMVTAGRHTVTFFPGSLSKDTDITVVDKTLTTGIVEVQLFPEGLTFKKPVMLATFTYDLAYPGNLTMYWWNPATGLWEDIGGQVTVDGLGVFTWLQHFSTYRPGTTSGKAGW